MRAASGAPSLPVRWVSRWCTTCCREAPGSNSALHTVVCSGRNGLAVGRGGAWIRGGGRSLSSPNKKALVTSPLILPAPNSPPPPEGHLPQHLAIGQLELKNVHRGLRSCCRSCRRRGRGCRGGRRLGCCSLVARLLLLPARRRPAGGATWHTRLASWGQWLQQERDPGSEAEVHQRGAQVAGEESAAGVSLHQVVGAPAGTGKERAQLGARRQQRQRAACQRAQGAAVTHTQLGCR